MLPEISETIRRYWGFSELRPLQSEAIAAGLAQRDSLVVMPTGGGKSLCYQVPPVVAGRTDVVVSPLISLMKDQVDGLRECGYPAAALHSGLDAQERRTAERGLAAGQFRLVFVAPERLVTPWFGDLMQRMQVRCFAIDEAHCISQWGHDFRPEYRQLAMLKERFPQASVHAFTATATPRVRDDIVQQLRLQNASVLVGCFDRPNLIYRILPQMDRERQVLEVLQDHPKEAAIVYCISRKDTESMAGWLKDKGIRAAHYHAGMDADLRRRTQDDFAQEKLDVVVATVAFGMGIDRSNVRCVIHAAMPKSIEHYQQETGRAGRDGLPADCVLLYSGGDISRWKSLIEFSAEKAAQPEAVTAAQFDLLAQMRRFCRAQRCRHRELSEYFGQTYAKPNCGACDVCLEQVQGAQDATVTAQKILSCVARVKEGFGVGHVVDVLQGGDTEMVRRRGHGQLSTYGLLKELPRKTIENYVYQLVDQGLLARTEGDRPVLQLNDHSWAVMRGQRPVQLLEPRAKKTRRRAAVEEDQWQGVDRELFESLRELRRQIAQEQGVPPFIILHDTTLRHLARQRPRSEGALAAIPGFGARKLAQFGQRILAHLQAKS